MISVAFADLSDEDQVRLLGISRTLTDAFRRRLAERTAPPADVYAAGTDTVLIRNNRPVRAARPKSQ